MKQITDFFLNLFGTESWPPRWYCGEWTEFHGWLYIISDLTIWAAYFTIPFLLIQFIIKKKDVPFPKVFWLFGSFILLCGSTHLIDAIIFYFPIYRFSAFVRFLTAIVSWGTIIALYKILPHAFSLKSPAELERVVEERTKELNQSVKYSSFLANAMPQMVWTLKPDGSVGYLNNKWEDYTGLPISLISENLNRKMYIHEDDIEMTNNLFEQFLNDIKPFEIQHRLRRHDGVFEWHLTRAIPHTDESGNILLWVGTSTNIQEQKEAENVKEQFLGIASHELKTPLTSVKAFTELALRKMEETSNQEEAKKYLRKSTHHLKRINTLVQDLMDVSRIESGKLTLHRQTFNLKELIEEVVNTLQVSTKTHDLNCEITEESLEINADRLRIEQVLINYISNAIKYSPNSDQIIIKANKEEGKVIVSVKDFGIGIDPAKQYKVFERFYRVSNTSERFSGLGIGLYICCQIIKSHGGKVWLKSAIGEGSEFYFCLPAIEEKMG